MGDGGNNNKKEKVLLIFQKHLLEVSFDKNKNHHLEVQFNVYFIRGKN